MADYQRRQIRLATPAVSKYSGHNVDAVIAANMKAWDDIVKSNPVVKIDTSATAFHPIGSGSGGVSASTQPVTTTAPNPATTVDPFKVSKDWLYKGPSDAVRAQVASQMTPREAPNTSSFIGSIFHGLGTGLDFLNKLAKGAVTDPLGKKLKPGENPFQQMGDVAKAGGSTDWADIVGLGHESFTPAEQLFNQYQSEHTDTGTFGLGRAINKPVGTQAGSDVGLRTARAAVDMVGDSLFNPLTYVPPGLALKGVSAVIGKSQAFKAAAEAAKYGPKGVIADDAAGEVAGQLSLPNMPKPEPVPSATPVTPVPVAPEVKVTEAATGAQNAAISEQLSLFEPPKGTQVHVTQEVKPVPNPPAVHPTVANEVTATQEAVVAKASNQPISESMLNTITSAETKAPQLTVAQMDGSIAAARQEIDTVRSQYNYIKNSRATASAEELPAIDRQLKFAQKTLSDAKKQHARLVKEKQAAFPVEQAPKSVNPASQVAPDVARPAEGAAGASEAVPGPSVQPTGAEPVGATSGPQSVVSPQQKARDLLESRKDKPQHANDHKLIAAADNGGKINVNGKTSIARIRTRAAEYGIEVADDGTVSYARTAKAQPTTTTPAIRDRAAIEADVARLKAERENIETILYKAEQSGNQGRIMNAQTKADMADEAVKAVERELADYKPPSEQLMPEPKKVTHNEISAEATQKVANHTAPEPPTPEVAAKAVAETKPTGVNKRLAVNKYGRVPFPRSTSRSAATGMIVKDGTGEKFLGTLDQASAYKAAYDHVLSVEDKTLRGIDRAVAHNDVLLPMLQKHKLDSVAAGWDFRISDVAKPGYKPSDYHLHHADVYEAALKHEENPHFISAADYKTARETLVPQGAQLVAAAKALDLEHAAMGEVEKITEIVKAMRVAGDRSTFSMPQKALESFARAMIKAAPELKEMAINNTAGLARKMEADVETVLTRSNKVLEDARAGSRTTAIHAVADMGGTVRKLGEEIGAHPEAVEAAAAGHATHAAQQGITETEVAAAKANLANERVINKQMPNPNGSFSQGVHSYVRNRNIKQAKIVDAETDTTVTRNMSPVDKSRYTDVMDVGVRADYRSRARITKSVVESIRTGVERGAGYGIRVPRDLSRRQMGNATYHINIVSKAIEDIGKEFPDLAAQQRAIAAIQHGTIPDATNDALAAAVHTDMKDLIELMFETGKGTKQRLGTMYSSGHDYAQINKEFDMMGVDSRFRFDTKNIHKGMSPDDVHELVSGQWMNWDFKNPLVDLDKLHSAMITMKARKDMAEDLVKLFGREPGTPGTYRVKNSRDKDWMTQYIGQDVHFPEVIASQIGDLEYGMFKGMKFTDKGFGRFMNTTYVPIMNLLKKFQTTARPSFAARNVSGDWFATAMVDNYYSPRYYNNALKMMETIGQVKATGLGVDAATKGLSQYGKKDFMKVTLRGGRVEQQSINDTVRANLDEGLLQTYHAADDVNVNRITGEVESRSSLPGRIANKIGDSKPMRFAGEWSDKSSTFTRLAHMDALMRDASFTKQFATLEDAYTGAAARVRWTHPDPGSLTHVEGKYLRQIIPYYTWQRSIIAPTLLSMVANPRNLVIMPNLFEALNTIANSNEGNEGTGNNWDKATLRPGYISNNPLGAFGNIGGLARGFIGGGGGTPGSDSVGLDLSSPYENMFGAQGLLSGTDSDQGIGGMLRAIPGKIASQAAPLIEAPIAALAGKEIGEHGFKDIKSSADYIDSLIPGAGTVAALTGISPSGTVGNIFAGKGLDSTNAIDTGVKQRWRNTDIMNFFLPGKFNDVNTKTNQQNALKELLRREGVPKKYSSSGG